MNKKWLYGPEKLQDFLPTGHDQHKRVFLLFLSQFELVCMRGSFGFISTSVIFFGFFVGSIFVSSISDKFGRKYPLFICGCLCCVFNFASAFAPSFWVFTLCRGITGFMIGKYVYITVVWSINLCESGPVHTVPGEIGNSGVFYHIRPTVCGRRGGLMVSALVSGSSGAGSSPGRGHCVVFLGKALNSHSASLHPGV